MASSSGRDKDRRQGDDEVISLDEAGEALRRSGYLLEDRMDTLLRATGYHTAPNSTFPDPKTGESRELDILAELRKTEERETARRGVTHDLIIECVNNPQPIAFITKKHQTSGLASIVKGFPPSVTTIPHDPETGRYQGKVLTEALEMRTYHHYAQGPVATQYCTFQWKAHGQSRKANRRDPSGGQEWMATHDDRENGRFRKLCDAVDHYSPKFNVSPASVILLYPIMVVQGGLLEVHQEGDELKVRPTERIGYTHALYRGEKQVRYRLDIVTEPHFTMFLGRLEQTREEVMRRLWLPPFDHSTNSTEPRGEESR